MNDWLLIIVLVLLFGWQGPVMLLAGLFLLMLAWFMVCWVLRL